MDPLRRDAVLRGLAWMHEFLSRDGQLFLLGSQCIGMFYDVFLSETDDEVCEVARMYTVALLELFEERWLEHWPLPWTGAHLLSVISLVRYEPCGFDLGPLLQRADAALECGGIDMRNLTLDDYGNFQSGMLTTSQWFDAMYAAFKWEYCESVYPGRFHPPPRVSMREILQGLRRHVFEAPTQVEPRARTSATATASLLSMNVHAAIFIPMQVEPSSDFGECYYLATHMIYWLSAHSATLEFADAPWLVTYVQHCLEFCKSE